jgi:hypothetical protein
MSTRAIIIAVLLLSTFSAGFWLSWRLSKKEATERIEQDASVILEQTRSVMQLVIVEGHFHEIYNETNHKDVTLYLPIPTNWTFSRSAMLEVRGKVLVGYDMSKMSITIDSSRHQIRLSNLPDPKILAVDHQVIYRNLEESFFNEFEVGDYTQLNKNAKEVLKQKAAESGLLEKAKSRGNQLITMLEQLAAASGWTVVVEGNTNQLQG